MHRCRSPLPLHSTPTKRAALISQRRASATESQPGTAVVHITSESQSNSLCQTQSKAGPSAAGSSQMHAEPASRLVSLPAQRSATSIANAATAKRRNRFAILSSKRQRVDSDSEEYEDEDDGVIYRKGNSKDFKDLEQIKCRGCEKLFESPWHMVKHPCASSDYAEARCPFSDTCPDKHLTSQGIIRHLFFKHFKHRFCCKECNVTKPFESLLRDHYAKEHNDMHPCPAKGCTLIFKKAINLKRHAKSHKKNFATSSCSTPLAKPSASTSVSVCRPASISSSPPSVAKENVAAYSMTSDVTLTLQACTVSTPPPASSGVASCDANSGQEAQDFVDMEADVFLLPDSPDPLPMSFAEDDDDGDLLSKLMTEIEVPFDRTQEQVDKSITSQATLQEHDSLTTPAATIEALETIGPIFPEPQAGPLTANEPEEVETVNNQISAESLQPLVPSHQAEQSVPSLSSAISCSHPISPERQAIVPHGISECLPIESPAQGRKTMPVPVGRPSLSKHSLSCLSDPVWRCDACGVMLFSEAGHTCSADLLQLVTHNESHESVSLEDGFLCINLD